jgi:hypothetical protein
LDNGERDGIYMQWTNPTYNVPCQSSVSQAVLFSVALVTKEIKQVCVSLTVRAVRVSVCESEKQE